MEDHLYFHASGSFIYLRIDEAISGYQWQICELHNETPLMIASRRFVSAEVARDHGQAPLDRLAREAFKAT